MSERTSRPPRPPPGAAAPTRRSPLPASRPKAGEDDPEAAARLRAILDHPGHRRADEDVEFLHRDELRGVRLQLEYQKPELLLREAGVGRTIVVFGGTRFVEPGEARRALEIARAELTQHPDDAERARRVRVAERIFANSHYYVVAREFGRIVGRCGAGPEDCCLVVMTGGGPGLMEAANRGAHDVGAKSAGLNITLPEEQYPNPYLTPDLSFNFRYFALRKMHFMLRAAALVAFPGGYGTLDELFETLCLVQTRKREALPVVLVGESYWRRVFDVDFLAAEGAIDPEDLELFCYAETAEEIWRRILDWHAQAGQALLP